MAALRPGVIGAVIRKDFQSLWPLAFAALLLPLSLGAQKWNHSSPSWMSVVDTVGALAIVALVLTVLQQDSPASPRHDWLTRPIGQANLLTAKLAFLSLTVALPMTIAQVSDQLARGHGWGEAALGSLSILTSGLFIAVPVVLFGLVTGSLIEAGVVGFTLAIVALVFSSAFRPPFDLSGTRWIGGLIGNAIGLAFCIAAAWLLLRRKKVFAARATLIAAVVVAFLIPRYFPSTAAVALQQLGGAGSPEANALATNLTEPCHEGGKRGSVLRSDLVVGNLPPGWRLQVDQVSATYKPADGTSGGRVHGSASWDPRNGGRWRLAADRLPADPAGSMRWTYALTLLAPRISHDLKADGLRRFVPGLGYCEASGGRPSVQVECVKPFGQPAAMTLHVKDRPETLCLNCGAVDYTPDWLKGFGSRRRASTYLEDRESPAAPLPPEPVVTVTAYEARTHFNRSTVTAAPRADIPANCPRQSRS